MALRGISRVKSNSYGARKNVMLNYVASEGTAIATLVVLLVVLVVPVVLLVVLLVVLVVLVVPVVLVALVVPVIIVPLVGLLVKQLLAASCLRGPGS